MTPVILAALALMGAPSTTVVHCDRNLGDAGQTLLLNPPVITLGAVACEAVKIAGPQARRRFRGIYASENAFVVGGGLLVLLHEAAHASGIVDETDAECAALAKLPLFLRRYLAPFDARRGMLAVFMFDRAMPPEYHTHSC